jgi:hypothetical protein
MRKFTRRFVYTLGSLDTDSCTLGRAFCASRSALSGFQMADHRVRFTLGSHIWFGSLDFLCMGVDHDMIQLPPSVPIDHASLLGSD